MDFVPLRATALCALLFAGVDLRAGDVAEATIRDCRLGGVMARPRTRRALTVSDEMGKVGPLERISLRRTQCLFVD